MSYVIVPTERCVYGESGTPRCANGVVPLRAPCPGCLGDGTWAMLAAPIRVRRSGFALFRGREGSRYGKAPTDPVPAKLIPEANAAPHTPILWVEQ